MSLDALRTRWERAWPDALATWSKFTRLRAPALCLTDAEAKKEGLSGSFAMIRLVDQSVVVSLPGVTRSKLEDYALEVLAHEIGHHVLAPATLSDHARAITRMRVALPTVERHAPMVANLYTDLLINDRLQRSAELRVADIYRALSPDGESGAVWTLYLRIYEILWNLPRESLGGGKTDDRVEGDAWLGARLVRSYAREWLEGSGRFAALLLPYLLEDEKSMQQLEKLFDTKDAAIGGDPAGLSEAEAGERAGAIHPAQDAELNGDAQGELNGKAAPPQEPPKEVAEPAGGRGQTRQPFEYGEILRAAGLKLTDHEIAVRYYRERSLPHLVPFPKRRTPKSVEPLPEGLEPWDIGHPLDAADWLQSILYSPKVVPGMTTLQRMWGTTEGDLPKFEPVDLDLYVDSSGSMANPQQQLSFPALAGAIICLSALRAGARVQCTLWSGSHQFIKTEGFVRDEEAILRVLTGYFGGGTAFPIHVLRDTFAARKKDARPAHILVVSDDGVSTLFDKDEQNNSGWDIARMALEHARGGGTLVLNLPEDWEDGKHGPGYWGLAYQAIVKARDDLGFAVHRVASWDDLVDFAREFSRRRYALSENAA